MNLINEIGKHTAYTELDFLCWFYAKAYGVVPSAVTVDRHVITPASGVTSDSVRLFLTVRLGSSPTRGTENYQRLDIARLFDDVEEIKMGAGGVPAIVEFKAYIRNLISMPMDGIDVNVIGNAFTLSAQPTSMLFTGKKTVYVR